MFTGIHRFCICYSCSLIIIGLTPDRVLAHVHDHDLVRGQGVSAADQDLLRGAVPAAKLVMKELDLEARADQTQKEEVLLLLAGPNPDQRLGRVAGKMVNVFY